MASSSKDYILNYNFTVTFGPVSLGFSKISNLESTVDYDSFVEGGNNDYPVFLYKPKQEPDTIIFERGLTTNLTDYAFALLMEGMKITGVTIFVKKKGKTCRIFTFDEGLITKRGFTELDANKTSVFIESLEIAHTGLYEIPVPPIF